MTDTDTYETGLLVSQAYRRFVDDFADVSGRTWGNLDEDQARVLLALLGLNGEIGEVTELFKKYLFHGKPLDRDDLRKEMGDVLWYFTLLCLEQNVSLPELLVENMKKLCDRYDRDLNAYWHA